MNAAAVHKPNNSYESEPSSGSGSSLSENNDCPSIDMENVHLPYLLKPKLDENEVYKKANSHTGTGVHKTEQLKKSVTPIAQQLPTVTTPASTYISSQESPFLGFTDSPFGKIRRELYSQEEHDFGVPGKKTFKNVYDTIVTENDCHGNLAAAEPGKTVFGKFYDTIISENSCNAVDMPLSHSDAIQLVSETIETHAAELSFNGKIKSFSTVSQREASASDQTETNLVHNRLDETVNEVGTQALETSFVLRKYNKQRSPDLFADDDESLAENGEQPQHVVETNEPISKQDTSTKEHSFNRSFNCPTESSFADEPTTLDSAATQQSENVAQRLYRDNVKRERELLHRIRKCLSGVPPPPSLTIPQVDLVNVVLSRKDEILNFFKTTAETGITDKQSQRESLFKPTHTFAEVMEMPWREILGARHVGLCYNLTKASESNEYLGLSVVERFVGAETATSYRRSPSSAKKRNARLKLLTQSPGNRLSHLAKRRAIFSSANLATTSQKSTSSLGPQILIDKRKTKNRRKATPKRKTPGSKKKTRKTPSSSAKRLYRCEASKPGPSRETSKRALFQSPPKEIQRQIIPPKLQIKPEIATRVEKSKRALFSPDTSESCSQPVASSSSIAMLESLQQKRKRSHFDYDNDDDAMELSAHSSKMLRMSAENLTPRALKIKSQSFCIGAGSSTSLLSSTLGFNRTNTATSTGSSLLSLASSSSSLCVSSRSDTQQLQRAHSDMVAPANTSLTENQKKKLLWAVSQALQEKKISSKHECFKQYASVLARLVRRIFLEYYQKTSTSNSETMLRLAKKYAYYVVSGKTADDVYLQVKTQIDESKRLSMQRLTGYIGPEEYQQLKKQQQQLSQSSLISSTASQLLSQSFCGVGGSMQHLFSGDSSFDAFSQQSTQGRMIPLTQSNLHGSMLSQELWSSMENVNNNVTTKSASKQQAIQAKPTLQNSSSKSNLGSLALRENSGQKNFTGKDQRNMSPYASINDAALQAASSAKAKRQIVFDS